MHPIWIFQFLEKLMEMGLFTAAACRVLFTLGKRFQLAGRYNSRLGSASHFAAAATRARAVRLLQLYHSAPISWTRVNKRQRSCRFPRLQAEKVRDNPSQRNCKASASIFWVETVKLSSGCRLHFFSLDVSRLGGLGRAVGPLPVRRPGHVTWVPIPSTTLGTLAYSLLITIPPHHLYTRIQFPSHIGHHFLTRI